MHSRKEVVNTEVPVIDLWGVTCKFTNTKLRKIDYIAFTSSNFVENKFSEVKIPPFGPKLNSFITSLYRTVSLISIFAPNGRLITAGSRFKT